MEESTTTESTATEAAAEEAQTTTEQATDSAVTTDESTTEQTINTDETTTEADGTAEEATDENLEWLKSKGIDPSDTAAMAKVAKMYRDAEKAMHKSTGEASELKKALSAPTTAAATTDGTATQQDQQVEQQEQQQQDDPVATLSARMQALEMAQNINSFFSTTPDAKQYETQMATIVTGNPTIGALVKTGYLTVSDLYNMARGSDPQRDEQLKKDGEREALKKVADKQQGKAVQGQATSSAFSDENKKDPFREALLGHI
jgi:hypothetical protein